MATQQFGTTTTTILTAVAFSKALAEADVATIAQLIKDDSIAAAGSHPVLNEAFSKNGLLYVPNRGILKVKDGDVVAVDNNGWPILVSQNSIAFGSTRWVLT